MSPAAPGARGCNFPAFRYGGALKGRILPGDGWLFAGLDVMEPLSARHLNRAVNDAAAANSGFPWRPTSRLKAKAEGWTPSLGSTLSASLEHSRR